MPKYKDVKLDMGRTTLTINGGSSERTKQKIHLTTDVFTITFDEHKIIFYLEPADSYSLGEFWEEMQSDAFKNIDIELFEAQDDQLYRGDDDYPQQLKLFIERWE